MADYEEALRKKVEQARKEATESKFLTLDELEEYLLGSNSKFRGDLVNRIKENIGFTDDVLGMALYGTNALVFCEFGGDDKNKKEKIAKKYSQDKLGLGDDILNGSMVLGQLERLAQEAPEGTLIRTFGEAHIEPVRNYVEMLKEYFLSTFPTDNPKP